MYDKKRDVCSGSLSGMPIKGLFISEFFNVMDEQPIGKVIHYFDKAMVAVVKLDGAIATGDNIKIVKGDNEFEMTVDSMQINHEPVERGKSGEEVAVKVTNPTKEGALVYKVA